MKIERGVMITQLARSFAEEVNKFWKRYGFIGEEILNAGQELQRLLNGVILLDTTLQKRIFLNRVRERSKLIWIRFGKSKNRLIQTLVMLSRSMDEITLWVQQAWVNESPPKEWYRLCEEFIEAGKTFEGVFKRFLHKNKKR